MKEYVVVNHFNLAALRILVNDHLTDGFVLVGGVSAVFDQREGCMYYFQAMAK